MKKIFALFLLISIVKIYLSFSFPSPWVFGDAAIYTAKTRAILSEGNFNFDEYHYGGPKIPPLYSMVLIPAYFFDDPAVNHRIILIINALLTSSIIFPAFFLARRFLKETPAVLAALAVGFYPSLFGYSFTVMSENLFLPLFLFTAWIFSESFRRKNWRLEMLLGLLFAGLFLTRVVGIFAFAAWLLFAFFTFFQQRAKRQFLLRKCLTLVFFALPVLWWYGVKTVDPASSADAITGYPLSDYLNATWSMFSSRPLFIRFLQLFLHQLSFLNLATLFFIVPMFFGTLLFHDPHRKRFLKKLFPLIFFFAFQFILSFGASIIHQYIYSIKIPARYEVFGRYIESPTPLLILLSLIMLFSYRKHLSLPKKTGFLLLFIIGVVASLRFLPFGYYDIVNNVPLLYIRGLNFVADMPWFWYVIFLLNWVFFFFPKRFLKRVMVLCLMIFWALSYVPAYKLEVSASKAHAEKAKVILELSRQIPKNTVIGFDKKDLWEKGNIQLFWLYEFWLGKNYHLKLSDDTEPWSFFLSDRDLPFSVLYSDRFIRLYKR